MYAYRIVVTLRRMHTNITLFVVSTVFERICVDLSVSTHPDANTIFLPAENC